MDKIMDEDPLFVGEPVEAFYCPYTNSAQCALLAKGWQPQELCVALECDQMKTLNRKARKRRRAA